MIRTVIFRDWLHMDFVINDIEWQDNNSAKAFMLDAMINNQCDICELESDKLYAVITGGIGKVQDFDFLTDGLEYKIYGVERG